MYLTILFGLAGIYRDFSISDAVRFNVELVKDPLPLVHGDGGGGVGGESVGSRNGPSKHARTERISADRFLSHQFCSLLTSQR